MSKTGQTISDGVSDKTILKAMIDADLSMEDLKVQLGKSRSAIRLAIYYPALVPNVRQALLEKLNLRPTVPSHA